MTRALVLSLLLLHPFAAPGRVEAQEPPPQPRPGPTFRTTVDRVAVDVVVIDRRGRPIRDLTADEFQITVDGKPRRIASAQFFSMTEEATATPVVAGPYSTNEGIGGGRQIMIVVDEGNMSRASARVPVDAAGRFVDSLTSADRIGLHVIPGTGPRIDFTANHALVKASLKQIVGEAEPMSGFHNIGVAEAFALDRNDQFVWREVVERECSGQSGAALGQCEDAIGTEARLLISQIRERSQASLFALRALLMRLAGSPGPKTIVFVSEGLVVERDIGDLAWIGSLAAAAQVSMYVLRLDRNEIDVTISRLSPTRTEDRELRISGLETLAGMARGAVFNATSNPSLAFERLSVEMSAYYLLGFEPEPSDRDGRTHNIRVQVSRPGVTIRARREFAIDPKRASMSDEEKLAETIRSPLVASDVPVRATVYTLFDPASAKLKVVLAAVIDPSRQRGDLSLAFTVVDTRGRLAASRIERPLVTQPAPNGWLSYVGGVLVEPGDYTVKIAVLGADGTRGSLEHTFRAGLGAAGQVKFGDLMIAEPRRSAAEPARPVAEPTVETDTLLTYLELYSDVADQLSHASVRFEVAQNTNGRALESSAARAQEDPSRRKRSLEARVPIALLPPGDYIARAIVSLGDRAVARVTRPFRIVRTAATSVSTRSAGGRLARRAPIAPAQAPFDRAAALQPRVVGFFLDRMQTGAEAAPGRAVQIAMEHARAGRFDEAEKALADEADTALAAAFVRGLAQYAKGDLAAAADSFRRSLRISSEFFPAVFYLGACYAAGGKDREAAGAWQTALVTESEAPFVYTMLTDAFIRLREGDQALDIAREADGLWPDSDEVKLRLATASAMTGEWPQALAALDPYLQRHPDDVERLFLGMRLVYEAHAAGRAIESSEKDLARFDRYRAAYAAASGPRGELVDEWRRFIEKKK